MTIQEATGQAYMNGMEKGKRMMVNQILSELTKLEESSSAYESAIIRKVSDMIGGMLND